MYLVEADPLIEKAKALLPKKQCTKELQEKLYYLKLENMLEKAKKVEEAQNTVSGLMTAMYICRQIYSRTHSEAIVDVMNDITIAIEKIQCAAKKLGN